MHWENVELTSRSCVFRCETLCFCSTLFFALKFCNCGCTSLWLETSTCVCRGSQMKSLLHQLLSMVLHLEYIAKHLKERAHLIVICSIVLERYTILLLDHWNPIQFTFIDVGGQDPEFQMRTPRDQFPVTFVVAGDLGQTGWTKSTLDHIDQCKYDVHLLPGDLSYADYIQHRWDTFGELVAPLASARPWMVTEGNHEKESIRLLVDGFQSYNARWKMPFEESGSSSNLYCSFEVAGAHIIMLGSYTDYDENSDQYNWLKADLANVDRKKTPWLLVLFHVPWYNSNEAHQGEGDGMMEAMEPLLLCF